MAPKTAKQKKKKTKLVSSPETLPTSKKLKTSKDAHPTATATDEEDELDVRIVEAVEGLGVSDGEEEDLGFSRNYFIAKEATGLGNKSRNKISDIDLVDEQELRAALLTLVPKHEKEQTALVDSYKSLYSKWHFQLRCGFGLLMYGFGSKRNLLEDFASSTLTDGGVVVINGYLPSVNMKHIEEHKDDEILQPELSWWLLKKYLFRLSCDQFILRGGINIQRELERHLESAKSFAEVQQAFVAVRLLKLLVWSTLESALFCYDNQSRENVAPVERESQHSDDILCA